MILPFYIPSRSGIVLLLLILGIHSRKPNIVFILLDDWGSSDWGSEADGVKMPCLNQLAGSGIYFSTHYAMPLCTPSRAAIMTGKYPSSIGMQHFVGVHGQRYGLPLDEILLPQLLSEKGYKTNAVGKWHLGHFSEEYLPHNRGFKHFFGFYIGTSDYYSHSAVEVCINEEVCNLERKTKRATTPGYDFHANGRRYNATGQYSTTVFTEEAIRIIHHHSIHEKEESPLFLYVAHQAVHSASDSNSPQAPENYIRQYEFMNDSTRRQYAAAATAADDSTARIIEALKVYQMWDNTLIMVLGDNGGRNVNGGYNFPLRGQKFTLYEGGTRTHAVLSGPALVTAAASWLSKATSSDSSGDGGDSSGGGDDALFRETHDTTSTTTNSSTRTTSASPLEWSYSSSLNNALRESVFLDTTSSTTITTTITNTTPSDNKPAGSLSSASTPHHLYGDRNIRADYPSMFHMVDWLPTLLAAVTMQEENQPATATVDTNTAAAAAFNTLPNNIDGINHWSNILHHFTEYHLPNVTSTTTAQQSACSHDISDVSALLTSLEQPANTSENNNINNNKYNKYSSNDYTNDSYSSNSSNSINISSNTNSEICRHHHHPRTEMLYNIDSWHSDGSGGCGALRVGRWKLVVNGTCGYEQRTGRLDSRERPPERTHRDRDRDRDRYSSCHEHSDKPTTATATGFDMSRVELFDLDVDSLELHDVLSDFPHIANILAQRLQYYRSKAVPDRQSVELGDSESLPVLHGGEYGPWVSLPPASLY